MNWNSYILCQLLFLKHVPVQLLRFVIFLSQRLINMKDYDNKLYENIEDLIL